MTKMKYEFWSDDDGKADLNWLLEECSCSLEKPEVQAIANKIAKKWGVFGEIPIDAFIKLIEKETFEGKTVLERLINEDIIKGIPPFEDGDYFIDKNENIYKLVWDDSVCSLYLIGLTDNSIEYISEGDNLKETIKDSYTHGHFEKLTPCKLDIKIK